MFMGRHMRGGSLEGQGFVKDPAVSLKALLPLVQREAGMPPMLTCQLVILCLEQTDKLLTANNVTVGDFPLQGFVLLRYTVFPHSGLMVAPVN